jgi:hypothetical protein
MVLPFSSFSEPLRKLVISYILIDKPYSLGDKVGLSPVHLTCRFLQVTPPITKVADNINRITIIRSLKEKPTHASSKGGGLARQFGQYGTPRSITNRPRRCKQLLVYTGYIPLD